MAASRSIVRLFLLLFQYSMWIFLILFLISDYNSLD